MLFFELSVLIIGFNMIREMLYRNLGVRTRFFVVNYIWAYICICIRILMLGCIAFYVLPLAWLLCVESWAINNPLYWRFTNDNFLKKIATINGICCWIIWTIVILMFFLAFVYVPFFIFGLFYILFKAGCEGLLIIFSIITNII